MAAQPHRSAPHPAAQHGADGPDAAGDAPTHGAVVPMQAVPHSVLPPPPDPTALPLTSRLYLAMTLPMELVAVQM